MLLLQGDIKPNTANIYGRTPLFITARKGHDGVVEMLLERLEVNPNTADQDGKKLLFWAANKGQEGAAGVGRRQAQYYK